jgi:hypothetical protein
MANEQITESIDASFDAFEKKVLKNTARAIVIAALGGVVGQGAYEIEKAYDNQRQNSAVYQEYKRWARFEYSCYTLKKLIDNSNILENAKNLERRITSPETSSVFLFASEVLETPAPVKNTYYASLAAMVGGFAAAFSYILVFGNHVENKIKQNK